MPKRTLPAVDDALAPAHGVSRGGQPISYNRAPAADLAPWIGRLYATVVDAPAGYSLDCGIFVDAAAVRIQLRGQWTAHTRDEPLHHERAALLFGPQTKLMPVSVTGSFTSIGLTIRPGSGHALRGANVADLCDRIMPLGAIGLDGAAAIAAMDAAADPEDALLTLEELARRVIHKVGAARPDPLTVQFEALTFADPSASIAAFAQQCGVTQRQLERVVRRDFGMPPKQVLRRARALDMASHLRGVADADEAEELALRYYDQSHLIRDFTALFGMSPTQFVARPQPILTLGLESRQARRLEMIERLQPGQVRPWECPVS